MLRKYRGTFIFAGGAKEEALDDALAKVHGEIEKLGGNVLDTDVKGRRTFARPMSKRDSGVYALIMFELDGGNIDKLLSRYKLSDEVFRVQIVLAPPEKPAEEPAAEAEAEAPVEESVEA